MPMTRTLIAGAAILALVACENLTQDERLVVGTLGGAAAGLITADALNASRNWTIIATLAGAAAGVLVARNQTTGECAYSRGDGTYYVAPCPR